MYALQKKCISCVFNTTRRAVPLFPGIILSYDKKLPAADSRFSHLSVRELLRLCCWKLDCTNMFTAAHILVDWLKLLRGLRYGFPAAESKCWGFRDQSRLSRGQTWRSAAAFLLSRLLSSSCVAAPLQLYSESIQQLQLSAGEDPGLLSDAKSVWVARECSLHLPVSSQKQLSLYEWGRFYTSKKDTLNTLRPAPALKQRAARPRVTFAECQTTPCDFCLPPGPQPEAEVMN